MGGSRGFLGRSVRRVVSVALVALLLAGVTPVIAPAASPPTAFQANMPVSTPSDPATITVEWIGSDEGTVVAGYSFEWSEDTTVVPDQTLETTRAYVAVSAGYFHTVGLKSDGTAVAVGNNDDGQCNVSGWSDLIAVSAGGDHTVGLKSDGTAVAVGNNGSGQCNVSGWTDLVAISAGDYHTVGLKSDGTAVAVGNNGFGRCDVSAWTDLVAVSAGTWHTVGLSKEGTAVAVGWNGYGQCNVSGWTDIAAISAGGWHTVGLASDGTAVAVGDNTYDQCDVSGWSDLDAISAGGWHTIGLGSDGTAVAVGWNDYGQCGVSGWTDIVAVSSGGWHTTGLGSDGIAVAAGDNSYGQCDLPVSPGPGATTSSFTPPARDGVWWFNVRAVDVFGESTDAAHYGPFVIEVNDAPVAVADSYTASEATTLAVDAPGVLDNDTDDEDDPLSAHEVSAPGHGTLALETDGSFTYLPESGFWGEDAFTYYAHDGLLDSDPATVTITVEDVTPPTTTSDAVATYFAFADITLSATDTASGVAATYYSLDGATAVAGTSIHTDVLGDHTLEFWSEDVAGNEEDPTEVDFTVEAASTDYKTVAGTDRYSTAIRASRRAFASAPCVVIATGEDWPDALGAAALAGVKGGPVLLSPKAGLTAAVKLEIGRLGATEAFVLGSTDSLSAKVASDLTALGLAVRRLEGSDRYATARAVAREVIRAQGLSYDGGCFVTSGQDFPDALGAGPLAAAMGWPIVLSPKDAIPGSTLSAMEGWGVDEVLVLGGTGSLAAGVETALDGRFGAADVERLAGTNRYKTAIAVARHGVANCGLAWDGLALARGEHYADALAGGPMQAAAGSVLLLTPGASLDPSVKRLLENKAALIDDVVFLGDESALSPKVRSAVAATLR